MIPKIIYYAWFGKGKKSELEEKCIASWKQHCPDYRIVEINETNFDIENWPYLNEDKKVGRSIEIEKQFIKYSKADLIERYLDMGGTADEIKEKSFSCYSPVNGEECGKCYPCFRKFALLSYFGATYTEAQERKMWEYIKKNIIPTKEQGGYNGTYYTDRGEESTYLIACVENLRRKYDS